MTETATVWRYTAGALLCVSLVLGGWVRLSGLEAKSISHPEMYVPGIPLPEGISEPAPRMTVSRILTGTFSSDTHPPGYYLLMFPWTRVAGTSLRAIRLPSAVFGLASILLVFWLGSLAGWRLSGALAAALLAFSGYHVFWSKVARMFAWNCFLGLAATVLLLVIARGRGPRPMLTPLYVITILAGVASHVFFWSLFTVHMIWTLGNVRGGRELPDICRAQLLAFVLGSPLLAFAAYQSGNTVAELSSNVVAFLAQFLPFAFALPDKTSGFFTSSVPFEGALVFLAAKGILLLLAVGLLARGLRGLFRSPAERPLLTAEPSRRRWWRLGWVSAGAIGTLEIGCFLLMVRQLPPEFINSTIRITKLLLILPFTLTLVALLLDHYSSKLPELHLWKRIVAGEGALLALLAVGPLILLAGFAQFRPILNERGFLFAAPYLLLALAVGVVTLRRKVRIAALTPVLVLTCFASLKAYSGMMVDPADYARFAHQITPEIRSSDLVFIHKAWYETPILYYLRQDRYRLVGRNYEAVCSRDPDARVWVVLLYDSDPARDMQNALAGYRAVKTIAAPYAKAILYEHADWPKSNILSKTFEN